MFEKHSPSFVSLPLKHARRYAGTLVRGRARGRYLRSNYKDSFTTGVMMSWIGISHLAAFRAYAIASTREIPAERCCIGNRYVDINLTGVYTCVVAHMCRPLALVSPRLSSRISRPVHVALIQTRSVRQCPRRDVSTVVT